MKYRHMYWTVFILWLMMVAANCLNHSTIELYANNQKLLLRECIKADSTLVVREDTIKALRFKLQTLNND